MNRNSTAFSELKKLSTILKRYHLIDGTVTKANILKTSLSVFSSDGQFYLTHLFQEKGADLGLCPYFCIFFKKESETTLSPYSRVIARAIKEKGLNGCTLRGDWCLWQLNLEKERR